MSPVNVGAIGAYIREQREQAKISLRQLAQSAGISNPYLSQIERGLRRPSADILQQIAKGLRISAEALYVQAGFLEDRPPGSVVREAVLTDPELTERQKQMLIEIYESFRKETALAQADADAAELEDDPPGMMPDEAELAWPENLTPAAVAGQPRRLAIAVSYPQAADDVADYDDDDEDEEGADEPASSLRPDRYLQDVSYAETADDQDAEDHEAQDRDGGADGQTAAEKGKLEQDRRGARRHAPEPGPDPEGSGPGGTIHQFPPPAGTR
jgi:transcriptional regulator with XRE-family HTH domain